MYVGIVGTYACEYNVALVQNKKSDALILGVQVAINHMKWVLETVGYVLGKKQWFSERKD